MKYSEKGEACAKSSSLISKCDACGAFSMSLICLFAARQLQGFQWGHLFCPLMFSGSSCSWKIGRWCVCIVVMNDHIRPYNISTFSLFWGEACTHHIPFAKICITLYYQGEAWASEAWMVRWILVDAAASQGMAMVTVTTGLPQMKPKAKVASLRAACFRKTWPIHKWVVDQKTGWGSGGSALI